MPADDGHRQLDAECRTLAVAVAGDGNRSAVQFHDLLGDGQAEPEPAMRARGAHLRLAESVEHMRQEFALDADAGVGHFDGHHGAVAARGHGDAAALRRELHGVAQQIPDHLLQAAGIGANHAEIAGDARAQPDAARGRHGFDGLDGALDDIGEHRFVQRELELARGDARHVEQIVDHLLLSDGGAIDHLHAIRAILGRKLFVGEHARPQTDGVERRAQFVTHHRDEFVFRAVGLFGARRRAFRRGNGRLEPVFGDLGSPCCRA